MSKGVDFIVVSYNDAFITTATLHPNAAFNPRCYSGERQIFKKTRACWLVYSLVAMVESQSLPIAWKSGCKSDAAFV